MPHILAKSAAVVAVSESTKQDLVNCFYVSPDKVHVVYNGYDDARFKHVENMQPVLDHYGLKPREYILFVGSILKHKNLLRLIDAFAKLKQNVRLVVAGSCKDTGYLYEILKASEILGVRNRFLYLEYVPDDDLPSLYSGALTFILPSLHEGFGVPLIEAMACGTPVITSNCSAMPEVAGDSAVLVDPYSVDSIASAMHEILNNHRRADSLRQAGLERAKSFSWSASARKLYSLCEMISGSKPQDQSG
jgi:glycosyltransferase involved in cell wall biosynthesis